MMAAIGAKNGPRVRRDWSSANAHHRPDGYASCRVCGSNEGVELAHLAGREHDFTPALGFEEIPLIRSHLFVAPTRCAPLCGPSVDTGTCHNLHHAGRLELAPHLTREEEIQLVADIGLVAAYNSATHDEESP